jgi:hypothetical protein
MATIITVIAGGVTAVDFAAGNTISNFRDRRDFDIAAVLR